MRAATRWLGDGRVALSVVPHGRADAGARRLAASLGILMPVDRSRLPRPGPEPTFAFPEIRRRRLANGLDAWTAVHQRSATLVGARARARAVPSFDPADRPGLAAITGDLLDEGCGDLDALALHEALGRLGAQLDTEVGSDATLIGLTTLERSAAPSLALARRHAHPAQAGRGGDFERVRDLRLNRLLQMRDMPPAVAERVFTRAALRARIPTATCRSAAKYRSARWTPGSRWRSISACTIRRA